MVMYLPRSAWTDVPKPDGLVRMDAGLVRGDAQHWPGGNVDFGSKSMQQIATYLEAIRRFHVNTRGWTDVAYQQAIDPAGRIWELRGIEHKSAANGDTGPNAAWGATLWLVGPNEVPTQAAVTAYQTQRQERWLRRYGDATKVVRHSDVRPDGTACPGPHVGKLVLNGTLTRPPEEDMALDAADKAAIRSIVDASNREVAPGAVWGHTIVDTNGKGLNAGLRLSATHLRSVELEAIAKGTDEIVREVLTLVEQPGHVVLTPEQVAELTSSLTGILGPLVQAALTGVLNNTSLTVGDQT